MFCRKCGNKLNDDDLFCPDCGTKVQALPKNEPAFQPQSGGFRGLIFEEGKELPLNVQPNEAEDATELSAHEPESEEKEEATEVADVDATVAYKPQINNEDDKTVAYRTADVKSEITDENETEIAQPAPEADESAGSVPLPLFADEDEPTVLLAKGEVMPEEENATEVMQESEPDEPTVMMNDGENDDTLLLDDSYDVYSGAIPGVTSQDFSYRTDNGFGGMNQGYEQPAASGYIEPDYGYQPVISQGGYSQYQPEQPQYPQAPMEEPPKKKNAAMWVIIACIAVIIIALGASCAVILTQYDSFGDFFASFSESVKETDDDEDKDEEKEEKTTNPDETQAVTEQTTAEALTEPTTAPRVYDGYCGSQVMYDYDEASKQLTVFGTGEMQNYERTSAPWAGYDVSAVVIEEGVTSVTAGTFAAVSPLSISIPDSVVSFDVTAVNRFGAINVSPSNSVYMSSNGVLFDKTQSILIAYPNMSVSTSYAVPEGVTMIGKYAFYDAANLQSLVLSSTVVFIDEYAFKDCTGILSMEIPATVTEIRTGIFYGWQATQKIRVVNPETKAVEDWNEGCGAYVTIG